jgi:hypothetical protein
MIKDNKDVGLVIQRTDRVSGQSTLKIFNTETGLYDVRYGDGTDPKTKIGNVVMLLDDGYDALPMDRLTQDEKYYIKQTTAHIRRDRRMIYDVFGVNGMIGHLRAKFLMAYQNATGTNQIRTATPLPQRPQTADKPERGGPA